MKKLLLSAFISLSTIYVSAQPVFTSANCFQMGDSASMGFAAVNMDISTFVPQTGSNHVWDFSSNTGGGVWSSWTSLVGYYLMRPGSASGYTVYQPFPLNEYSWNVPFAPDRMFSYSPANDTLYLMADFVGSNPMAIVPPQPYLTFPLNYMDSVSTITQRFFGASLVGESVRSWKYDGFGTVKMPYGNFNSIYRIHTVQRDTSFLLNFAVVYEELLWFEQSTGVPILRMRRNGATMDVFYASTQGGATGIDGNTSPLDISVGPNPFRSSIQIKLPEAWGAADICIHDITGRQVWRKANVASGLLDLAGLAPGNYAMVITSATDGRQIVRKLRKDTE